MMEKRKISDSIFHFPATESPLSADVGIVQCADGVWRYDVGSSDEAASAIDAIPGKKTVILSHFHPDHTGNIDRVPYDMLYAGKFTCEKLGGIGISVEDHMYFENGIHLFPLPSCHAKGCMGLEYGAYAFLGDAVYATNKDGRTAYNAGLLKELIAVLKALEASFFLVSHSVPFVKPKTEVMAELEEIYALRSPREPFIFLQ